MKTAAYTLIGLTLLASPATAQTREDGIKAIEAKAGASIDQTVGKIGEAVSTLRDAFLEGLSNVYFSIQKNKELPQLTEADRFGLIALLPNDFRSGAVLENEPLTFAERVSGMHTDGNARLLIERQLGINLTAVETFSSVKNPPKDQRKPGTMLSLSGQNFDASTFVNTQKNGFNVFYASKKGTSFLIASAEPYVSIRIETTDDEDGSKALNILSRLNANNIQKAFKVDGNKDTMDALLQEKRKMESDPAYIQTVLTFMQENADALKETD